MHSPYFPSTDPQSDVSLPSTWSGRVPCPRFNGTIKTLRLPAVPPAALRCLGGTTRCPWRFAPTDPETSSVDPEFFGCGNPQHSLGRWKRSGSPKFPGNPPCLFAHVLRPRQNCPPLTVAVRQHGPREGNSEGSYIG